MPVQAQPKAALGAAVPAFDAKALIGTFEQSLKTLKHASPKGSLLVVSRDKVLISHRIGMTADDQVPLGRLGELLASILLLKQAEAGKLKLGDPVNYSLKGFAMSEPFGEIGLRHLLERSSGLPERESGIYVRGARHLPKLKDLLIQDLKPAVLAPGQAITHHSAGDVLQAQLLHDLAGSSFADQVEAQLIKPLGLSRLKLPDPKAKIRTLTGHDSKGLSFPSFHGSAHDVHDWVAPPLSLKPLLQALLGASPRVVSARIQEQLLTRSLTDSDELPTTSLGMFEETLRGQTFFNLDSNWFGHTARLAVFPSQGLAFLLSYDSSNPKPLDALTEAFTKSLAPVASQPSTPPYRRTESKSISVQYELPVILDETGALYSLSTRDSHSLLKAIDLFDPHELVSQETAAKASRNDHQLVWPEDGRQMQISEEDPNSLQQGYGFHGTFREVSGLITWPWQLALAALFGMLFLSVILRASRFIYAYEPPFEPEAAQAARQEVMSAELSETVPAEALLATAPDESNVTQVTEVVESTETPVAVSIQSEPAAEESSKAPASWDIPLVGLIPSVLGLSFMLGIQPIMMQTGHIGDHLSFALRNEPNGLLLAWLAMPLFAIVTSLILFALIAASWKDRPWGKFERLHYLGLILGIGLWTAWLTSWNLLGFRF